jgi:flagellar protein FlaG
MTLQIGRFTPYEQLASAMSVAPAAARPQDAAPQLAKGVEETGTIVGDVPPAPTPEARELVAKAAEVVETLRKNNRELHFSRDEDSNRLVIQVRDLDGKVLKTIPPSEALNIMAGGEL